MLLINSSRLCPYDHKRLAIDMGQHESEGDLEVVHFCLDCTYSEVQRPERDKTSDGPPLTMAALRDKVRDPHKPLSPPLTIAAMVEEEAQR
jgi:hypothetical protein